MIIREWEPEDLDELVQLNYQWGYETNKDLVAANLQRIKGLNNAEVFVAENELQVAGFIYVMEHIIIGGLPFAEVHGLVVNEKIRRQGIGKALIEKAKSWGKAKDLNKLRLRTNIKREETNAFYPKIGFSIIKKQNVYEIDL